VHKDHKELLGLQAASLDFKEDKELKAHKVQQEQQVLKAHKEPLAPLAVSLDSKEDKELRARKVQQEQQVHKVRREPPGLQVA
jgi:hypothetical protein